MGYKTMKFSVNGRHNADVTPKKTKQVLRSKYSSMPDLLRVTKINYARGLTCMIEFSNPYVDSISKSLFRNGQVNPHDIECPAQFINTVLHAPQLKVFNQVLSLGADFGKELLNRRLFPQEKRWQRKVRLIILPSLNISAISNNLTEDLVMSCYGSFNYFRLFMKQMSHFCFYKFRRNAY